MYVIFTNFFVLDEYEQLIWVTAMLALILINAFLQTRLGCTNQMMSAGLRIIVKDGECSLYSAAIALLLNNLQALHTSSAISVRNDFLHFLEAVQLINRSLVFSVVNIAMALHAPVCAYYVASSRSFYNNPFSFLTHPKDYLAIVFCDVSYVDNLWAHIWEGSFITVVVHTAACTVSCVLVFSLGYVMHTTKQMLQYRCRPSRRIYQQRELKTSRSGISTCMLKPARSKLPQNAYLKWLIMLMLT